MHGERRLTLAFVRDISERKAYTEGLEHQALHDEPHRLGQSHPVRRARPQDARLGQAGRRAAGGPRDGSRRVQAGQRHARTRPGRRPAQAGRRPPRRGAARDRHDRPARGRRVRDPARPVRPTWPPRRRSRGRSSTRARPGSASTTRWSYVSASVGIAMFPEHGRTADELLRRADVAMYVAKRTGSGHAVVDAVQEAGDGPAAGAPRRPAAVHRPRRAGPSLPAQDRPRDTPGRPASRRSFAGSIPNAVCSCRAASCPRWRAPS